MKKKLVINCASCDARNIKEENYSGYESITVNAATVLTSAEGKAVLNRLPVALNCAGITEIEGDAELRTVNGKCEIKSSDAAPEKKYFLTVNGSLTVGSDTQKYFENCVGMLVNGSVTCPESVYAALTGLKVNGSVNCYPDGAVVMKRNAVIDSLFALRAKNSLYWSAKRMIMVDPELDANVLKAKGASFSANEIIIAKSKVEAMADLIDEKAEMIIVPDGTAVILKDVTLNNTVLRKHGGRLYIIGDAVVPEKDDILDELEYLAVRGDAKVSEERKAKLIEALNEITGDVKVIKPRGCIIEDKPYLKITKWMLEKHTDGLEITDCAIVTVADDIPKELIAERLSITDCATVKCSKEQEDAVSLICEDVASIETGDGDDMSIGNMIKGFIGSADTKVINAESYVM